MAFSQLTITDGPSLARSGRELAVAWSSSSPDGTVFQLYLNGRLAWHGTARRARLPWPAGDARVEVGTVAADEGATDFSGSLPAAPNGSDPARLDGRVLAGGPGRIPRLHGHGARRGRELLGPRRDGPGHPRRGVVRRLGHLRLG
jgi:hypothetical protein